MNHELVTLYWSIGKAIIEKQDEQGWGAKVVELIAKDLHREFPGMSGLSSRNLKYMRAFAEAYSDGSIVQQLVAQLPWGHNILLLTKVKKPEHRQWYAQATIANGWTCLPAGRAARCLMRRWQRMRIAGRARPSPISSVRCPPSVRTLHNRH